MIVVQWHIKCIACTSEFGAGREGVSAISASGYVSACMSRANQCPMTAESWESVDWKSALVEPRGLSKRPRALNANVWHWFALQTHSTQFVIMCFVVKCLGVFLHDWELSSTMRIFFLWWKSQFLIALTTFSTAPPQMVLFCKFILFLAASYIMFFYVILYYNVISFRKECVCIYILVFSKKKIHLTNYK